MARKAGRGAVIQLSRRGNLISAGEGLRGRKSHRTENCNLTQAVIGIARRGFSEYNFLMSLHRSLRSGGSTAAKRNVLKRFERVTLLKKRGQWKAGMKSTGLPKTKPE
jgi:small basic protein (TIGR04137 family)